MKISFFWGLLAVLNTACHGRESGQQQVKDANSLPDYELRTVLVHDTSAFTQGLVYDKGRILEGTGGDSSWIARYDIATGTYQKEVVLDKAYFGEGITVLDNKLYQLTWKSNTGFVYDATTFESLGTFSYDFEGWGITHDGRYLIISDGSHKLHYFDPATLKEEFTKKVKHKGRPVKQLNELEFIKGYLYANQWETNHILKIDTASAEVVEKIDLSPLVREVQRLNPQADVLNGIAYNPETDEVYITGKRWPRMYVLRFKGQ